MAEAWFTYECDWCRTSCTTNSIASMMMFADQHAQDPCTVDHDDEDVDEEA